MKESRQTDGIGIFPAMTFDEIGIALGVTPARARQVYLSAMRKLRTYANRKDAREILSAIEQRRRYATTAAENHAVGKVSMSDLRFQMDIDIRAGEGRAEIA